MTNAVERPCWISDMRRKAARLRRADGGRSIWRRISPSPRTFSLLPVVKSTASIVWRDPSGAQIEYVPSSATDNEIIGPAGSDMQMFPPTVAACQILNDDRNESQHR